MSAHIVTYVIVPPKEIGRPEPQNEFDFAVHPAVSQ